MKRALLLALAIVVASFASCSSVPSPVDEPVQAPVVRSTPEPDAVAPVAQPLPPQPQEVTIHIPVLTKESAFFADGQLDQYTVTEWSPDLLRTLSLKTFDASRPDPVERIVYEYEGSALRAKTVLDAEGKVQYREEYAVDGRGLVTEERLLDPKGQVQSLSRYAYNEKGEKVEWRLFDGSGVLKTVTYYVYAEGLLVEVRVTEGSGATIASSRLEYDAQGRLVKRSYLGQGGALERSELYRYEGGFLAEYNALRADGSVEQRVVYEAGTEGAPAVATVYDGRGRVRLLKKFEYAFREEKRLVYP